MKKILLLFSLTILTTISYSQTEISVSEVNEKLEVKDKWVVVEYYADWCAVCKKMKPDYKKISEEYGDKIDFYSVNATDMNIQDFKINFPSVGYYFNDNKLSAPTHLKTGIRTYTALSVFVNSLVEKPNKKDSNYKPACSLDKIKIYSVGTVLVNDASRDDFNAPFPEEERSKLDKDSEFAIKLFDGKIQSNYKFTYIPNPKELLLKEELEEVNHMFYSKLYENKTNDFVVVRVEFINPDLESRAVVYLGFDRADYGCGFYDYTDAFFPDLD